MQEEADERCDGSWRHSSSQMYLLQDLLLGLNGTLTNLQVMSGLSSPCCDLYLCFLKSLQAYDVGDQSYLAVRFFQDMTKKLSAVFTFLTFKRAYHNLVS